MKKLNCVVAGFPDSYSEYGKLTVNIFEALIKIRGNYWNISIVNANDGSTSMGYIDDHTWIKDYLVDYITEQPDIWIQIGSPEHYSRHGTLFNIGICAANLTNVITRRIIDGINRMDLLLTTSERCHDSIVNTVLEYRGNAEVAVKDKVAIPVHKIKVGVHSSLDNYKKTVMLSQIKENYCFIYNGMWKHPVDVNNVGKLIYCFYSAFRDVKNKPALILKTNVSVPSIVDLYRIENRIKEIKSRFSNPNTLPSIYIINGNIADDTMMGIYNNPKVKCMVSLSSNETIGINLKEFQLTGKPILTSGWGGQTDLGNYAVTIDTNLVQVDKSLVVDDLIAPNSTYGDPVLQKSVEALYFMFNNKIHPHTSSKFTSNVTSTTLEEALSKYILNTTKSNYLPETEEFIL